PLDVVRGERIAAVEADSLPEVEDVRGRVRRLPARGESGLEGALERVTEQAFVDVCLEGVRGGAVGDVRVPAGGVPEQGDLERAAGLRRRVGGESGGREDAQDGEESPELPQPHRVTSVSRDPVAGRDCLPPAVCRRAYRDTSGDVKGAYPGTRVEATLSHAEKERTEEDPGPRREAFRSSCRTRRSRTIVPA